MRGGRRAARPWGRASGGACGALRRPLADEADDVLGGGARAEDGLEAELLQGLDVVVGDDAAGEEEDLVGSDVARAECLDDAGEELHVGAGEDAEADDVDVL